MYIKEWKELKYASITLRSNMFHLRIEVLFDIYLIMYMDLRGVLYTDACLFILSCCVGTWPQLFRAKKDPITCKHLCTSDIVRRRKPKSTIEMVLEQRRCLL